MSRTSDRDLIEETFSNVAIDVLPFLRTMGRQEAYLVLAEHRTGQGLYILLCYPEGELFGITPLHQEADDFLQDALPDIAPGVVSGVSAWAAAQPWQVLDCRRLVCVEVDGHVN